MTALLKQLQTCRRRGISLSVLAAAPLSYSFVLSACTPRARQPLETTHSKEMHAFGMMYICLMVTTASQNLFMRLNRCV